MNRHDAIYAMLGGAKVRGAYWDDRIPGYLYMDGATGQIFHGCCTSNLFTTTVFSMEFTDEYKLCVEAKVTVRLAPAVVKLSLDGDKYEITYRLYESEDTARADNGTDFVCWPAYSDLYVTVMV